VNPRIVLVHVSGYGQSGPYARRPGYGTVAEGMSGIPSFTGFPDGPPTLSAFPLADCLAATFALVGLLSAVYERDIAGSGRGQEVDVSLYEPLFRVAESQVIGYDQLGIVKERMGNRLPEDSPRNTYVTDDEEWVAISASSDVCEAGQGDRQDGSGHGSSLFRQSRPIRNDAALDTDRRRVDERAFERGDHRVLERFDVVAGLTMTSPMLSRPAVQARENIVGVLDPDWRGVKMPGVVPRFSRTPGSVRFPARSAGTTSRLPLGLGLERPERLRTEQVAQCRSRSSSPGVSAYEKRDGNVLTGILASCEGDACACRVARRGGRARARPS
jgi:crotonobetainyl-CoA:carnitine CoA-transferase CaiB-like acyl-CoA transferase